MRQSKIPRSCYFAVCQNEYICILQLKRLLVKKVNVWMRVLFLKVMMTYIYFYSILEEKGAGSSSSTIGDSRPDGLFLSNLLNLSVSTEGRELYTFLTHSFSILKITQSHLLNISISSNKKILASNCRMSRCEQSLKLHVMRNRKSINIAKA